MGTIEVHAASSQSLEVLVSLEVLYFMDLGDVIAPSSCRGRYRQF